MSQCATKMQTLLNACLDNDVAMLTTVIDPGSVNAPVLDGLLPLQVAATAGSCRVVRALVAQGAHVDATDDAAHSKNTALHFAVLARRTEAVQTLLELGADPNALNCVDTSPMHDAARVGDVQIAASLKRHGADLLRDNGYGNTIAHRACLHNNHDLVLWALRSVPLAHRALFLARRNHAGFNVLDIATSRKARTMIRLLEALGASTSQPQEVLMERGYTEVHAWKIFLRDVQLKIADDVALPETSSVG